MIIYKDKELNEQVMDKIFDLGIALAGETVDYTFYVKNDLAATVEAKFSIEAQDSTKVSQDLAKEIKILEYPSRIKAFQVGELKLQWKPSVTLKKGLKAKIRIKGYEIWG